MGIWKEIPLNIETMKLDSVYKLTVFHCNEYKKYCQSHTEYGATTMGVWCEQKMKNFNCSEFIWNDILSIILDKMDIANNEDVQRMFKYKYKNIDAVKLSYDMLINSINRIVKILDDEKCKNSARNMANIEKYGEDQYSRNYLP